MDIERPVSAYVVLDVDVCVEYVFETTCNTVPLVGVVAEMYRHAVPFQIATMSVSVSYII
jgi:hypothetical protein